VPAPSDEPRAMTKISDEDRVRDALAGRSALTDDEPPGYGWVRRWPIWSGWVTQLVLGVYAVALAAEILGGPAIFAPSSNPDNTFDTHWLTTLPADRIAPSGLVLACIGLIVLEAQRRRVRTARGVLAAVALGLAGYLSLVLPGSSSLDVVPGLNLLNLRRFGWPTAHLTLLCYAGLALAASTAAYLRATRDACLYCGRRPERDIARGLARQRLGIAVTVLAAIAPCGYAVSRLLWAAGIPVGTTEAFLERINAANPADVTVTLEIIMATMALSGGFLTVGLLRPWSRIWPRWIPWLAGHPVPHAFPVAAGTIFGVGLTGLGTMVWPGLLRFASGETVYFDGTTVPMTWISQIPALSLGIWGPLVLLATAAFHQRTRARCRRCGRA
jgi:hypothetical protein